MVGLLTLIALIAPRPNLVYIMADDLGYGDLGCYGQTKIPTPNLDRLAAQGMRMTRAYSGSPVCAPTRYSLLTGKHQGHAAIRGNRELGGFGPNDREGQTPIQAQETLVSEILKGNGYRTGLVGKWGLGGPLKGQFPMDHGFDSFYGYLCQRRAHNFYPPYLWRNTEVDLLDNPVYAAHQKIAKPLASDEDYEAAYGGKTYSPARLAAACVDFIKAKDDKPFFLYYAPTLPHLALQAPKDWVSRFPREWDKEPYLGQNGYLPNPRPRAAYAAMVAYLDDTVGQIMAALEAAGKSENTLIIFTSDNGAVDKVGGADLPFFRSNGGLRAGKMSLYEGGIRVPLIARWPGEIKPGSVSDRVVTCYDALATLCAASSIRAASKDGISYLPTLKGEPQRARDFAYFEYPEASIMQAALFGKYKVIKPNLKSNRDLVELYDLDADPFEAKNLAASHPSELAVGLAILKREHRPNLEFPLGLLDRRN